MEWPTHLLIVGGGGVTHHLKAEKQKTPTPPCDPKLKNCSS